MPLPRFIFCYVTTKEVMSYSVILLADVQLLVCGCRWDNHSKVFGPIPLYVAINSIGQHSTFVDLIKWYHREFSRQWPTFPKRYLTNDVTLQTSFYSIVLFVRSK